MRQTETPCLHIGGHNAGDQKAADYEKHIDADKAAGETCESQVEKQNSQHRDRSKPVYVRAVTVPSRCRT
ncbi:hypothetical protein NKJ18_16825 [Mesorhizobium sp. M0217]